MWPQVYSFTGLSKLCNILFSRWEHIRARAEVSCNMNNLVIRELNRRYGSTGITSYALHPGVIPTGNPVAWPERIVFCTLIFILQNWVVTATWQASSTKLADCSWKASHRARPRRWASLRKHAIEFQNCNSHPCYHVFTITIRFTALFGLTPKIAWRGLWIAEQAANILKTGRMMFMWRGW